ncbi:DUF4276 family protein [Zoogloea sp.]|uniref:DUF4276 family protein n=1 Tax=Zoogloea sp. TaxID=49181 RepID=UPI001D99B2F3|nr:DUF4276 family protein [Zoogloea sp.]MBK6653359.1 DUF4276 family protein [Zoogloea sp.]MBK7847221.1 DUF4276 family protein [Zoogloea sp.]
MKRRLGICVEGMTERIFVRDVLTPHLAGFGLWTNTLDLRGNVSLDRLADILPGAVGNFDYLSTLVDFYGFKRRGKHTVDSLETAMVQLVSEHLRHRMLPYVQRYEFEALLFAVPENTVAAIHGSDRELRAMFEVLRSCGDPESINDGLQTSPSHRLLEIFSGRFNKPTHGPAIVAAAGLTAIRARCPRFDAWIARLEALGGQA